MNTLILRNMIFFFPFPNVFQVRLCLHIFAVYEELYCYIRHFRSAFVDLFERRLIIQEVFSSFCTKVGQFVFIVFIEGIGCLFYYFSCRTSQLYILKSLVIGLLELLQLQDYFTQYYWVNKLPHILGVIFYSLFWVVWGCFNVFTFIRKFFLIVVVFFLSFRVVPILYCTFFMFNYIKLFIQVAFAFFSRDVISYLAIHQRSYNVSSFFSVYKYALTDSINIINLVVYDDIPRFIYKLKLFFNFDLFFI